MQVLACQIAIPEFCDVHTRDAFLLHTAEKISATLARQSVDLVVLPELSSLAYSRNTFDHLAELAEHPEEGVSARVFGALAKRHRVHVAFGIARPAESGYRICHVVVDPDGQHLGYYDKLHMAQFGESMEKDYFRPGAGLLIFEVKGMRVAPVICYDFRFPELTRVLCVEHGVDFIIHPVAFAVDSTFPSWPPFAISRAIENQVYWLSVNRAGDAFGSSLFCPPWLDEQIAPVVFSKEEQLRVLEVDVDVIRRVREQYTFRTDRHRDYAGLPIVDVGAATNQ